MAKTYIRIYGPPLLKAIKALEGAAVEMSKATEVKFSHKCVPYPTRMQSDRRDWNNYLDNMRKMYVDCYEPQKIISEASATLGDYDFFFEWTENPTNKQINELINTVDETLSPLGCLYTVTTL